jgi:hypothetical protein
MTPAIKDTADMRARLLRIWKQIEAKEISAAEARLQIGVARAILETIKVEIAAAHLSTAQIPAIPVGGKIEFLPSSRSKHQ